MPNFDKITSVPEPVAHELFSLMEKYRSLEAFVSADNWMYSMLSRKETIVDVGCGFGGNASYLTSLGHKVTLVDIYDVEPFLPSDKSWDFILGNAYNIPISSSSVSVVWANRLVHHLDTPENFYAEASRVLEKNGKLLICFPQAKHFSCSDPVAQAAIIKFLGSGLNNVNPSSMSANISQAATAGFALVGGSYHSSRHQGPTSPYQLKDYFKGQSEEMRNVLSEEEERSVSSFMFSLAQGRETIDIKLTCLFFRKI